MAKEYAWQDTSIVVLGRTFEGVAEFKVKRKSTKERTYGRGRKALAITTGNEEISGSFKIHQSELNALNTAINAVQPGANLGTVSFDAIINYENSDGEAATDTVIGVEIEEYEKGMSQGAGKMEIDLPFIALDFKENI